MIAGTVRHNIIRNRFTWLIMQIHENVNNVNEMMVNWYANVKVLLA